MDQTYGYNYPYNQIPPTNHTPKVYSLYDLNIEDANWIMTSSFIIFTMQTGFGLLESGCVSIKNEVNIMMKNVVDIVLGGLTYWLFGFGLSFGESKYSNPFITFGDFSMNPSVDNPLMGPMLAAFLFQLSFATTATTIVSGAMAERCNFRAYCLFSSLNTIVYVLPAGWVWGEHGFLKRLGAVDIAGSGPVHLVGGSSAFISAIMLGPRLGRYLNGTDSLPLGSPVNAVMGLFVLWWGWLAFNSGSTYGLSGYRWHYAARAAVMTVLGSFGGGLWGLLYALYTSNSGSVDVLVIINSVLGSLVSVTGGCFLYNAWQSIIIGLIGGAITCITTPLIDKLGVDDPVGATSVHGICGLWGVIAIGFFAIDPKPLDTTNHRKGVFAGGGWYLLGVQALMGVCLMAWSMLITFLLLWIVNKIIPIRMDPHEELLGADLAEHRIRHGQVGVSRAMSALKPVLEHNDFDTIPYIGYNPGHESHIDEFYNITNSSNYKLSQISLLKRTLEEKMKNNKTVLTAVEELQNGQPPQKKNKESKDKKDRKDKRDAKNGSARQDSKSNNSSARKAKRFRNAVEILSHMQKNNKKPQIAWLD